MKYKTGLLVAFLIFFCSVLSGYFVYLNSQKKELREANIEYQNVILRLSDNIIIHDALRLSKTSKISSFDVKEMIGYQIKLDFERMVHLFSNYDLTESEYMRCLMTRKYRYLQSLVDFKDLVDFSDEVTKKTVAQYLEKYCPGETSHKNWAKCADKSRQETLNDKNCREE